MAQYVDVKAGRELDALIAERVMGFAVIVPPGDWLPAYSTDIAAAWQVVEKLRAVGHDFVFGSRIPTRWFAEFGPCGPIPTDLRCDADTAPLAICLAALKAVGYKW